MLATWLAPGFPLGERASAAAQASSTEGAPFLLLPVGAKAIGLGRAVSAFAGAQSVWWNPAGLAEVEGGRFLVYRSDHPVAGPNGATAASLVLTHTALGALGVSYQFFDNGSQDVTDEQSNLIGTLKGRGHLAVITLATRFGNRLNAGMNLKLVQDRFTCRGQCPDGSGLSATTFAVDAGVQLAPLSGIPLRLAAMVAHLGSDLQYLNEGQADPLPTRFRLAAAYDVMGHFVETDELGLSLAVELDNHWRDPGSPATYVGAEFRAGAEDVLYVRAGYVFDAELQVDGAAVGVGLHYERLELELAKSLATSVLQTETEPVHISFGFVF